MVSPYILKQAVCISILAIIFEKYHVLGFRSECYPNDEQPNCNTKFIDVYKDLSISSNDGTAADTWFWLFTRENPEKPELLHKCGGRLPPNTTFNAENELIIIITPYLAGFCDFAVYREWLLQMFEKGEYNFLVVDWSWGSKLLYSTAVKNSKITAEQTVIVLKNIQEETGIAKEKITIIGHSLAAHTAGIVGRNFPVGRITGIDPAGPSFNEYVDIDERLDPTDADFVDVWHCNAGDCLLHLGINYNAGDVDYWINGGSVQTGCRNNVIPSFARGDLLYALESVPSQGCSHVHCTQYYKTSINPGNCQYVGVKCENYEKFKEGKCNRCGENGENCILMSFDALKYVKNVTEISGTYYVKTSDNCPYCDNSDLQLEGFTKTYESSLQTDE